MDLVPIGQAAEQLGLTTSTLRYYDERGLVTPAARQGGKRMYGRPELRRLAFLKLAHTLGIPLDTAAAVLDEPGPDWRRLVTGQIDALTALIEQARGAQDFLTNAIDCPTDHPASECGVMIGALDRLLAGAAVDELRQPQGG